MKCPNCGAEIGESKVCDFCGTHITIDMQKEQEQLKKTGCPKCGSSNVKFNRENQGEVRGKNSKQIIHRTVGFCQDCGHTWDPAPNANSTPKKNTLIWWILGWIFFFPAPVMVLIWRKKNTWDIKVKIAVTAAFWILIFVLGSVNNGNENSSTKSSTTTSVEETREVENNQDDDAASTKAFDSSKQTETKQMEESVKEIVEDIIEEKDDGAPKEYKNALKKAEAYAKTMYMSKKAIYDQLTSEYGEKFPEDAAQYAIDNLECDWNANALKKAESYSDTMYMSKRAIYDQLTSEYGEQFTEEEAQYAIDNIVADWNANALEKAKTYQDSMDMSKASIYDQLISQYGEQFTPEEAQYAIDHLE